jgi:lysophospholipase L1-like esterase
LVALAPAASGCAESGRQASSGQPVPLPNSSSPQVDGGTDATAGVRYLALGDSFTIGTGASEATAFPARLSDRWRAKGCSLTLENVAVNGYTTEDLIDLELPSIASFRPTFVTVAVGANDIVRGHSLEVYRANVRRILDAAKAGGARVVVLPQPDWSRSPSAASFGTREALAESITRFNAALAEEARAKSLEWVDLVPLMQQQAVKGQVAADGLHPSAEAYDAWAAELARVLTSPCG